MIGKASPKACLGATTRWVGIGFPSANKRGTRLRGDHVQTKDRAGCRFEEKSSHSRRRGFVDGGAQPCQRSAEIVRPLAVEALLMRTKACDAGADFVLHLAMHDRERQESAWRRLAWRRLDRLDRVDRRGLDR